MTISAFQSSIGKQGENSGKWQHTACCFTISNDLCFRACPGKHSGPAKNDVRMPAGSVFACKLPHTGLCLICCRRSFARRALCCSSGTLSRCFGRLSGAALTHKHCCELKSSFKCPKYSLSCGEPKHKHDAIPAIICP